MFWNKSKKELSMAPPGFGATDFLNTNTPLKFNSVDFRDGQQSLFATRMTTADMVPILKAMDDIGYDSIEMWGGATFDVAARFLNEDPWDRVRIFKKHVTKTSLKMVLRAQNLVGYRTYPDDIVKKFIEKAASVGIDTFLTFDCLDDLRNCESAFSAIKKAGKKIEGSIQYNISPFHTIDVMVENALQQEQMGASLIHVEDMAGLMTPKSAYDIVIALKKRLSIPVHLHCHCTGGMAQMAYWEAIRAGVDGLDVCVSALSLGTAHPPIESFVTALKGTSRDPKIDVAKFTGINKYLEYIRPKYAEHETKLIGVDVACLQHQIPGGMLSNLESQLASMNMSHRLPEILEEVAKVRADMGYPPLATPSSQMCGAQATTNVITQKRYSIVSNEMKNYCRGMYGRPPGPISEELMQKALGDEKPTFKKPADMLEPEFEKAKAEIGNLAHSEEDILTYALFPGYAADFLEKKYSTSK